MHDIRDREKLIAAPYGLMRRHNTSPCKETNGDWWSIPIFKSGALPVCGYLNMIFLNDKSNDLLVNRKLKYYLVLRRQRH